MINAAYLIPFVRESNRIEGIHREPTADEILCTQHFLQLKALMIGPLQELVDVYQPGAKLRRHPGMDVRVGGFMPPLGGEQVPSLLRSLLNDAVDGSVHPYQAHLRYEALHPFMDGNGRSGRVIWLWQMLKLGGRAETQALNLGFLHTFYYQTLELYSR